MSKERTPIQQAIDLIDQLIQPNCDNHTPFRGSCVSCGQVSNPDILDPDKTIKELQNLRDTIEKEYIIKLKIESYPWRNNNMKLAKESAIAWYNEKYEKNDYL